MDDKARLYLKDIVSEWRNVLKTPANIHLLSTQLSVLCAMVEEAAEAERDALRAKLLDELSDSELQRLQAAAERDALREEVAALREQIAWARWVAQNALNRGGDKELVYAPLYQQALEDIASEEQDK